NYNTPVARVVSGEIITGTSQWINALRKNAQELRMSADSGAARTTEPQRSRPWSMLFRIFELSRDLYKIIIAIGAVIILTIGWTILGWIFGIGHDHHGVWPANADRGPNPFLVVTTPAERSQLFTWQLWFGQADQDPPLQVEPF